MKKKGIVFNEDRIHEYKRTGDDDLFGKILSELEGYIKTTCYQKLRNSPSTLYSMEDLISIAQVIVWQAIEKFIFICPECKAEFSTFELFNNHAIMKHNKELEPTPNISKYIKFNMGAYLQNEIRKEYCEDRKTNILTIDIFSPNQDDDEDSSHNSRLENSIITNNIEDDIIFNTIIKSIVIKFDEATREIFTLVFEEKMKQKEVAEKLFERGEYSSVDSAKVIVSRNIKNKIIPAIKEVFINSSN